MTTANPLLELILQRRSAAALVDPGPTPDELRQILAATSAVPDHGLLRPFRFLVAEGDGRKRFGDALAKVAAERSPEMPAAKLEKIHAKALRSPTLVAIVSSPKPGKIAPWEQMVAASCAGYAIVLAAHALGVGAVWKSVPFTRGAAFVEMLGLTETEEMIGWIHLGQRAYEQELPARPALALEQMVTVLEPDGARPYR